MDTKFKAKTSLVTKLLIIIGVTVALILGLLFFWMAKRQETQIINQVDKQARALFEQVVLTRAWVANQGGGGVYSEVTDNVEPNSYLLAIDSLPVNVTTEQGIHYTLRNPALVTRELSELAEEKETYSFRITSLQLLNPNNAPTPWEEESLKQFDQGVTETRLIETTGNEGEIYRYMAPLQVTEACLRCHATQGYEVGDVRGGISVSIPMAETRATIQENNRQMAFAGIGIILIVLLTLGTLIYSQVFRPLEELQQAATKMSRGNLKANIPVRSDEIGSLASAFNTVTSQLQETLEGLEVRVAARTKDLATVADISTITATIRDPFQMLVNMVHLTQRGFNLYHAHVFTYDIETNILSITACGFKEGDENEGTHETGTIHMGQEQSLVALAARTRQPVIINDVRNEPGWLPNALLPDTRSEMAVPMIVGDELLGVLDVQSEQLNAFTDEDANIQMTLAAQIGTALQNTHTYGEAQQRAELESLVNVIGQKIQRTTSIEETLQTAIRELGTAIGASRIKASIQSAASSTQIESPPSAEIFVTKTTDGDLSTQETEEIISD